MQTIPVIKALTPSSHVYLPKDTALVDLVENVLLTTGKFLENPDNRVTDRVYQGVYNGKPYHFRVSVLLDNIYCEGKVGRRYHEIVRKGRGFDFKEWGEGYSKQHAKFINLPFKDLTAENLIYRLCHY